MRQLMALDHGIAAGQHIVHYDRTFWSQRRVVVFLDPTSNVHHLLKLDGRRSIGGDVQVMADLDVLGEGDIAVWDATVWLVGDVDQVWGCQHDLLVFVGGDGDVESLLLVGFAVEEEKDRAEGQVAVWSGH